MSVRKKKYGTCHICGNCGPLSFEHNQPKKAGNNKRFVAEALKKPIPLKLKDIDAEKRLLLQGKIDADTLCDGTILQGGIGAHTLCEKCNPKAGRWYVPKYYDWYNQAKDVLNKFNGTFRIVHTYNIYPLAILKQIIIMFFSTNCDTFNYDTFREENQELASFVINRDKKGLSPKYRFFAYYNMEVNHCFYLPAQLGHANIALLAERVFPPFGYLMTINLEIQDTRYLEITHFSNYGYDEYTAITLNLSVLPPYINIYNRN